MSILDQTTTLNWCFCPLTNPTRYTDKRMGSQLVILQQLLKAGKGVNLSPLPHPTIYVSQRRQKSAPEIKKKKGRKIPTVKFIKLFLSLAGEMKPLTNLNRL